MTFTAMDADRIALSRNMMQLAEEFAIEATLWADPSCVAELRRVSRTLATIGRAVLATADYEKSRAYTEAGHLILRNVQGARRFFAQVLAQPNQLRKANDARP